MSLQVLRPGEGLPTTFFCADEAPIVIVFSEERGRQVAARHTRTATSRAKPYRLCRSSLDMLVKDQPHPPQSQMKGRSPANTSSSYSPPESKWSLDGSNGQREPPCLLKRWHQL